MFRIGRVRCFLVGETWIKIGRQEAWLWLAFEPYRRFFLGFQISRARDILTTGLFLQNLIDRYGRRPVYSDGVNWYSAASRSLGLEHHAHDAIRSDLMERFVQFMKDRTEDFDDYFPCRKERCRLEHVDDWLSCYVLSFDLFKRREAFKASPVLLRSQIIGGPKDSPQVNRPK